MKNTQDFLNQLDRLTFVSEDHKTLHTAEGFQISYSLELMSVVAGNYPIQFLFRVRKDDAYIMTWGCSSNEDNKLAVHWWLKKWYSISDREYEDKLVKETLAKKEFEDLTQTITNI